MYNFKVGVMKSYSDITLPGVTSLIQFYFRNPTRDYATLTTRIFNLLKLVTVHASLPSVTLAFPFSTGIPVDIRFLSTDLV